ncbi:hypothetical protein BFP97_04640 [Roseivirga sp. 4D4]|uniref:hybrid sensor histidine kinase/response regulator transcription factor n=1 Tax=Roseivirga sp. 4D4 TaxID=1889784 RepID=UPI0008535D81|nr:ATP-binding protein [Roseivirga sp. 4D4]OEK00839.1 hypothetical protein BFP97_04640 [Roseivirga sp. 4D4]
MTAPRFILTLAFTITAHLATAQQAFQLSDTTAIFERIMAIPDQVQQYASDERLMLDKTLEELKKVDIELENIISQIEDTSSLEYQAVRRLLRRVLMYELRESREPATQSVSDILALFERYEKYETNLGFFQIILDYTAQYLQQKGAYQEAITLYNRGISILYKENKNEEFLYYIYVSILGLYVELEAPYLAQSIIELIDNHPENPDRNYKEMSSQAVTLYKVQYHMMVGEYSQALEILKGLNLDKSKQQLALHTKVHFTFANALIKNNMLDSASSIVKSMYEIPLKEKEDLNLRRLAAIQVNLLQERWDKSESLIDSIGKFQFSDQRYQSLFYDAKIETYQKIRTLDFAFKEYEAFKNYSDSVKTTLSLSRAIGLNSFLKNEEAQIEISRQKEVAEAKAKQDTILYAGILLICFITALAYYRIRTERKKTLLESELSQSREIALIKSNFLNNLSHEIRTPLTVISGYLDLLGKNIFNRDNAVKYIERATRNSNALVSNLNNYLLLSRLDGSQDNHTIESNKSMGSFIEELVESFEAIASQKQQTLYYQSNIKRDVPVNYAFEHLEKVISNLLNNAVKYTPARKAIHVSAMISERNLMITIKDEGMGMDEEEVKHIFDRFYQSMRHQHIGGFGVGLALVKQLVDTLNGTIEVESALNLGSLFRVTLPLSIESDGFYVQDDYEDTFRCITQGEETPAAVEINENRPKLLVVDDNAELMLYLTDLFKTKYECHYAFNGQEALDIALSKQFDLIISDMKMPIMGGVELFNELRKDKNYEATPFIILSASFTEHQEDLVSTLGITDYILKPFVPSELVARINFLLQNKMYRKQLHETNGAKLQFEAKHTDLMQRLNEIILENLDKGEFGVKELVETSGYSQSRLNQIVTQQTGLSPVKIILEIRLLKAYEFIAKSKYQTVSEVCFAVGINSKSYFFKKFKERFGITAGDLMKKHSKDFSA